MTDFTPPDITHMPRMISPQQKLDEERGIAPESIVEGAVRLCIGGPSWQVEQMRDVIMFTLDKMGFEIVAKVAKVVTKEGADHDRQ
jgi:phage host-nuclease inhibitor protein Gam